MLLLAIYHSVARVGIEIISLQMISVKCFVTFSMVLAK